MDDTNEPGIKPAPIPIFGKMIVYVVFTLIVIGLASAAYDVVRELISDEPARPGCGFTEVHQAASIPSACKAPTGIL